MTVRAFWHRLRCRRRQRSMQDVFETMQAYWNGLDLELELPTPLPHYAEIIQLSDYREEGL